MQRRQFLEATAALALARPAWAAPQSVPVVKTGGVRMIAVPGGKVWTKAVGPKPNVLLLHGGPGASHDYMECFEDFLPPRGLGFYYYDQLGCGNSEHPNDDKLWTIARYVEEVEVVRKNLGLDQFILLGHSWGGMLAIEYALKYQQHLSKLVISNMTAGIPAYVEHARVIRAALPLADRATLDKYEALNKTDAPAYLAVMDKIYHAHVLSLKEWPEPVTRAFTRTNQRIYNLMQGPNEFVITGNLKSWERWKDLPKIKTPTLIMGAQNDEMDPAQIRREASLIPSAKLWMSNSGTHLAMYDDQQAYFGALLAFLKG